MRMTLARTALALVLAGTGLAIAPVASAQGAPEDVRVDLKLKDADMKAAVATLMQQTGLSIIFEASNEPFPKITLNLSKNTAEDALKYICLAANAYYRKDDNGVYIISMKKPEVAPAPAPPVVVKPGETKKLYKLKMQSADAQDVYAQMAWGVVLDPLRGFTEINRFKDLTNPNRNMMSGSNGVFLQGQDERAMQQYQPMNSQTLGGQPINRSDSGNGVDLPESASQFGGGGQGGNFPPGGGQGGRNPGGGGGQGQGGQGGTLSGGQGLIPAEITYITFDPNDNSIIVQATEAQYQDLLRYVAEFDVAPQQVTVKVEFITTSSSLSKSLGIDWLYSRSTMFAGNTPGTFARTSDPIFLSWATGNIQTRLRTLLQDGYGRVVASPVLRTLNNQPAVVTQGLNTTIFQSVVASIGNGQVIRQTNPITITVGTSLAIRPRINRDGTITMYLTPTISQLGQFRRDADGNEYPDTSFQAISVVARVKSGDTIALAGFTNKSDTGSGSKFPVLGDLPIIGQFFRSSNREKNYSELLVFVTPTIIDEDQGGIGP